MSTFGRFGGYGAGEDDRVVFSEKRIRELEARETELRTGLEQARARIIELDGAIKRLQSPPYQHATVLRVDRDHAIVTVAADGRALDLALPDVDVERYRVGTVVAVRPDSNQIVTIVPAVLTGEVHVVRTVKEGVVEVDAAGGIPLVVLVMPEVGTLEPGYRVLLDPSKSVVLQSLGAPESRYTFEGVTGVTWDDIGGLEDAKAEMIEAIEMPHLHADLYRRYGKRPIKGVLLYGPPGNGKTLLGKATATALARIHGEQAVGGFIYVKGPEILNRFVGNSEEAIRSMFERSREHKRKTGFPAVIFVDEAESILCKRGNDITTHIERTIVPMFLAEMDGLEDSGAVVLLATNRPDILDPAVVRDGRIDRKVKVTRPTREAAATIFRLCLRGKPTATAIDTLARAGVDELFSPKRVLFAIERLGKRFSNFTLGDVINGAMIAGVVDRATSIALRRDLTDKTAKGVARADVVEAVDRAYQQSRDLGYQEEIAEFVREYADEVTGVKRASTAV